MLADLTGVPVVYDFRSDYIMQGFEGAPLVLPHNAHISRLEGDGIYYNGGNTSNFAIIHKGVAQIGADAGPFNEYTDNYVRLHSEYSFDKDGMFGKEGQINWQLLQVIFDYGRVFYEAALPKSGDPAYYHKNEIFSYVENKKITFVDAVRTFEYAAAYMAAYVLALVPDNILLPEKIILFGGGWKNPVVQQSFIDLLRGKAAVLDEHQQQFANLQKRFVLPVEVRQSRFGDYMEARLFADLARYKLENDVWKLPEVVKSGKNIVCGVVAQPKTGRTEYSDKINRAAKGWQTKN
jgi:anhydro-N-acetylmuramic acid kinase